MPMFNCPDCGNSVSDAARACPKCGRPFHVERSHDSRERVIKKSVAVLLCALSASIACAQGIPGFPETIKGVFGKPFTSSPALDRVASITIPPAEAESGWIELSDTDADRMWFAYNKDKFMSGYIFSIAIKTAVKTISGNVSEINIFSGEISCLKNEAADYVGNPNMTTTQGIGMPIYNQSMGMRYPIVPGTIVAEVVKYSCGKLSLAN